MAVQLTFVTMYAAEIKWVCQFGIGRYFAVIGLYSVKTVADRYIHAAYHNITGDRLFRFVNIDDLE